MSNIKYYLRETPVSRVVRGNPDDISSFAYYDRTMKKWNGEDSEEIALDILYADICNYDEVSEERAKAIIYANT